MINDITVLGIDLGTTNSCIAINRNNKQEVIKNSLGSNLTPSIISFVKDKRYFENQAKKFILNNPKNTIFNMKRIIGRNFDDKEVQNDIKYWPFTVIKDEESNKPIIEIELNGKSEKYFPEEISGMILSYLKNLSEQYLHKKIKKAIIAVPAYFNERQRVATVNAGKIAGFNDIKLIDEPIAAAITYAYNKTLNKNKKILVFDLGGGTLDVSIVEIGKNNFKILTTNGDSHFGGEDFDQRLVDFCCKIIEKDYKLRISDNKKLINKLKFECEQAKILLSNNLETILYIDSFYKDIDLNIIITRIDFEAQCSDLFDKFIPIIEKTLKNINLTKKEINEVILVGGSTKIPRIQKIVKDYFKNIEFPININAEEIVAMGAAIQGRNNYSLKIANPYSIGLNVNEKKEKNITSVLIPKNVLLPFEKTETFSTSKKNQTKIAFDVYQGENYYSKDNTHIGGFVIKNIRKAEEGEVEFDVTLKLDENGILSFLVLETDNGKYKKKFIKNVINFNDEQIEDFKKKERQFNKNKSEFETQNTSTYNDNEKTIRESNTFINSSINGFEDLDKNIMRTKTENKKI